MLSAGPVASSALLRHSLILPGFPDSQVGKNISANVVTPVFATWPDGEEFSRSPDPGLQMCVYVDRGGKLLESWFHYPGSLAAGIPGWLEKHARVMRQYERMASCGVVVPSSNRGQVIPFGISGHRLSLSLSDEEFERIKEGVLEIASAYFRAGATEVFPSTSHAMSIRKNSPQDATAFRQRVCSQADIGLATAHPQGGNALGSAPKTSVVGPDFRVHGYENLFVADASLFPAGCDRNPQMTVMALAHLAANKLIEAAGS